MSLIRARRERREAGFGRKRPPPLWKLVATLLLVAGLIWYLGQVS